MKERVKPILPWIVGVAIFVVASLVFYAPQFEGKSLGQGDIAQYAGMSNVSSIFSDTVAAIFLWMLSSLNDNDAMYMAATVAERIMNMYFSALIELRFL